MAYNVKETQPPTSFVDLCGNIGDGIARVVGVTHQSSYVDDWDVVKHVIDRADVVAIANTTTTAVIDDGCHRRYR